MGIPYYFASLIRNHKNIVKNLESITNIHNLYLDSNSIIYDSLDFTLFQNKSQFENLIIQKVVDKIELIIKTINPSKNIIVAFDGVPPIAKLNQQKNRRYKSWSQEEITKSINKIEHQVKWNSAAITPGTNFMDKLDKKII